MAILTVKIDNLATLRMNEFFDYAGRCWALSRSREKEDAVGAELEDFYEGTVRSGHIEDIPVIFVAEEKESTTKSTNNPLAAVLGTVNTTRQIPPTLTFNADNEMVRTLLQIQGDNKMFQHVVHILYVQSLLQGKYPVNSEEMELFNHSLSELMTAKMNDFINFLN